METYILYRDISMAIAIIPISFFKKNDVMPAEFQRQIDEERVLQLAAASKIHGALSICVHGSKLSIIDGQHRLKAMLLKYDTNHNDVNVFCHIYWCDTKNEKYELFTQINSSKPLVLPETRTAGEKLRNITGYFKTKFEKYCKTTDNPRSPNINLLSCQKTIRDQGLLDLDSVIIESEIDSLNEFYKTVPIDVWHRWGVENVDKAAGEFLLGLFREFEWVIHLYTCLTTGKKFGEIEHRSIKNKEKITKAIRTELWKQYFKDSLNGSCCCCENKITYDYFEAGHIVSRIRGGDTKLSNLKPVCSGCNKDMGCGNMFTYIELLKKQKE
jgi:hypothetical protein